MNVLHRPIPRFLFSAVAPALLGACTMVGAAPSTPAPSPAPPSDGPAAPAAPAVVPREEADDSSPPPPAPESAEDIATRVVDLALASIGTPYEWGGMDTNGFDCSGLIQFAYGRYGIRLPRVSTDQIRAGSPVDPEPSLLQPGDVLGFATVGSASTSHVGLYVGRHEFIHSSTSGVRVSTLLDPYWQRRLVAARRIVE